MSINNEDVTLIKSYLDSAVAAAIEAAGVKVKKELVATIRYARPYSVRLNKIPQGDWIDVFADKDYLIKVGEHVLIDLGFSMKLPEGYEAHLAPRSSTFKNFGIIVVNSVGIIDESYCGDHDIWKLSVQCVSPRPIDEKAINKDTIMPDEKYYPNKEEFLDAIHKASIMENAVYIPRFTKIAQFRLFEKMPKLKFLEVDSLGTKDRGGFGSTGNF